jgi:hypothetical protein
MTSNETCYKADELTLKKIMFLITLILIKKRPVDLTSTGLSN